MSDRAPAPDRPLALSAGEVHLWRAPLDWPPEILDALAATLDLPERERAACFRFPRHRDRWIAARAALRDVLSRYLAASPRSLRFAAGPQGKPRLDGVDEPRFNLAHSGALALVAVAAGREVGVDLEELRPIPDAETVAAQFFSAAEREALRAAPGAEGFLRLWTRKEAALKRDGVGLSGRLDDASLAGVVEIDAGPGWLAALAVEGESYGLRRFDWSPPTRAP
jgi:4'-phosphopantetheinyl transferase